jgi:hypothetical protein
MEFIDGSLEEVDIEAGSDSWFDDEEMGVIIPGEPEELANPDVQIAEEPPKVGNQAL